jgi:hypothetical protein
MLTYKMVTELLEPSEHRLKSNSQSYVYKITVIIDFSVSMRTPTDLNTKKRVTLLCGVKY